MVYYVCHFICIWLAPACAMCGRNSGQTFFFGVFHMLYVQGKYKKYSSLLRENRVKSFFPLPSMSEHPYFRQRSCRKRVRDGGFSGWAWGHGVEFEFETKWTGGGSARCKKEMRIVTDRDWKAIPVIAGPEGETVALPRKLMLSMETWKEQACPAESVSMDSKKPLMETYCYARTLRNA